MMKRTRTILTGFGLMLALGTTLLGHMALRTAVPAADSTVTAAPSSIALTFTQAPDLSVSKLDLSGPSGVVGLTNLHVMDERTLMATVSGHMPDGSYTVAWQSAGDDGHVQKGTYSFTLKRAVQTTTDHADHLRHHFDPATDAKRFDDPARDAWQMPDRVIQALGVRDGMSVADVGAGTGYFTVRLARVGAGVKVYAADIEPAMVDHLKKRAADEHLVNVTPVLASDTSPNLPAPVDLVLVVNTYHHIGRRSEYFRNLRRSLTPGGRIAIVDFRKDAPEGPPVEFRFTPDQIRSEMAAAGFSATGEHDFLPRQHLLVFR